MDSLLAPILGVVGIVLTGVFTLLGVHSGKRREGEHWLRTERMRVYSEFLGEADSRATEAVYSLALSAQGGRPADPSLVGDMLRVTRRLAANISVLGPEDVFEAARAYSRVQERRVRDHMGGEDPEGPVSPELTDYRRPVAAGELGEARRALVMAMQRALKAQ